MRLAVVLLTVFVLLVSPVFAQQEIHINIPEYCLQLVDDGKIISTYDIAVGTPYKQTPPGTYKIFYKEVNPTWYPGEKFEDRTPVMAGPDNPLGTRWMEFFPTYGIHGTNKGLDIQYPVSGGCIRMHDKDAQELYDKVAIGTPVIIVYETMKLVEKADGLYLKVFPDIYGKQTNTKENFDVLYSSYADKYIMLAPPTFPLKMNDERVLEIKIAVPKNQQPVSTASAEVKNKNNMFCGVLTSDKTP